MASNNSQAGGSSQTPASNDLKSSDLKNVSQRVDLKVEIGLEVATKQLHKTAYTVLSQRKKNTLVAAIKAELKVNM